jgi:hypothetical protein
MSTELTFDPAAGSRLSWIPAGGEPVDLTRSVTRIVMHPMPDLRDQVIGLGWFKPIRASGRLQLTPAGFQVLFGRTHHPRVRRMHAAYGRRRGRGRW